MIPQKTKVAIIREEYVSITEKFEQALILNQFIYWTERVRDFDQFIEEENRRKDDHGLQEEMEEPTHGWIYKTAKQLSGELMTGWSPATTGRHLKALIALGFVEVRQNPKYKWNQTKQYRVDLNLVQSALHEKGYTLPGFTLGKPQISKKESPDFKMKIHNSDLQSVPIIEIKNKDYYDVQAPPPAEPVAQEQEKNSSLSFSENEIIKTLATLMALIQEPHRKPSVEKTIERGLKTHTEDYIKLAILYTIANSNGGTWQKFKAYLGKCIDNHWHDGWEPDVERVVSESIRQGFMGMPVKDLKFLADAGNKLAIDELDRRTKNK